MTEKMLVTQALDERDLLVKKIDSKIEKIQSIDTKRRNEERTARQRMSEEEFANQARSAFQQITDLVERYQRLDAAIIASNAATMIETSKGTYSVAGAISLRNRLKQRGIYEEDAGFEALLMEKLDEQYRDAVRTAEAKNKNIERQAEEMRLSILGKDTKNRDTKPLEVVDAYIKENTTELIDPLGIKKKLQKMKEDTEALLTELDTQIKVSNATTTIEF